MRRIVTSDAKVAARKAKDEAVERTREQFIKFITEAPITVNGNPRSILMPDVMIQQRYLESVNLSIADMVRYTDPQLYTYDCVPLQVVGAYSIALPGVSQSAYNRLRGNARLFVQVRICSPFGDKRIDALARTATLRWIESQYLVRKKTWDTLL